MRWYAVLKMKAITPRLWENPRQHLPPYPWRLPLAQAPAMQQVRYRKTKPESHPLEYYEIHICKWYLTYTELTNHIKLAPVLSNKHWHQRRGLDDIWRMQSLQNVLFTSVRCSGVTLTFKSMSSRSTRGTFDKSDTCESQNSCRRSTKQYMLI